ncbi:MAG: AAA family ATPase [Gemmatimonadota bacterium]|nr:AAA family ATPase [Gemmatimonadota bacterium]
MPSGNPTYVWIAARARNALRRRTLVSVVTGVAFILALIGLVLIPRETTHIVRVTTVHPTGKIADTTSATDALALARASIEQVDSSLTAARRLIALRQPAPPAPVDTLSLALRAERDSLTTILKSLSAAMSLAQESPLPPAFHALGVTPALASDSHVRSLLDSLDQVDKLRAPFGALGAGDPIYVSLTARVNELGRSIRDAATGRRSELRARLAPLAAPPPPVATLEATHVDTAGFVSARERAKQQFMLARQQLDSLRNMNARLDTAATQAREVANVGAPPIAMLGAALVIALAVGFSIVFVGEVRNPRVAHMREGEAVSNVRVLSVIQSSSVVERARRQSDVEAPPLIDLASESFRTLYLHLAATEASVPVITLTGDVPLVVATVAANLAAVAAYEARRTLLVDVDPSTSAIASVLRLDSDPGLSGVLNGNTDLAGAIVTTTIGRDRPLDVLPSGHGRIGTASPEAVRELHDTLARLERRYDFIVFAVPSGYAQLSANTIIRAPDVILCAQVGVTEVADLRGAVRRLRAAGKVVHGIVLWDDEPPRV